MEVAGRNVQPETGFAAKGDRGVHPAGCTDEECRSCRSCKSDNSVSDIALYCIISDRRLMLQSKAVHESHSPTGKKARKIYDTKPHITVEWFDSEGQPVHLSWKDSNGNVRSDSVSHLYPPPHFANPTTWKQWVASQK